MAAQPDPFFNQAQFDRIAASKQRKYTDPPKPIPSKGVVLGEEDAKALAVSVHAMPITGSDNDRLDALSYAVANVRAMQPSRGMRTTSNSLQRLQGQVFNPSMLSSTTAGQAPLPPARRVRPLQMRTDAVQQAPPAPSPLAIKPPSKGSTRVQRKVEI